MAPVEDVLYISLARMGDTDFATLQKALINQSQYLFVNKYVKENLQVMSY